jgi:hypothetical protein
VTPSIVLDIILVCLFLFLCISAVFLLFSVIFRANLVHDDKIENLFNACECFSVKFTVMTYLDGCRTAGFVSDRIEYDV